MFRPAWLLWSSIAVFLLAAGLEFALAQLPGRTIPTVAAIPWLLVAAATLSTIVSAAIATRRARGGLRRLGAIVQHLLVLCGGLAGFLAPYLEIFYTPPTHVTSLELPDGRGRAYLYSEGFFCKYTVWIAAPWSLTSQRQPGEYRCIDSASLAWDAEHDRVLVLGPDHEPAPPPKPLNLSLGGPC